TSATEALHALTNPNALTMNSQPELARARSARPERFQINESGESFSVSWRWFSMKHLAGAAFSVFWAGFLVTWYHQAEPASFPGLFALPYVGAGIWLVYTSLADFLNTTRVTLLPDELRIRHGPLPWKGNLRIAAADISQLYCTTKEHKTRGG